MISLFSPKYIKSYTRLIVHDVVQNIKTSVQDHAKHPSISIEKLITLTSDHSRRKGLHNDGEE